MGRGSKRRRNAAFGCKEWLLRGRTHRCLRVEPLERRDLLSSILSGTVFLDANLNGERDGIGVSAVSGVELGPRGPVVLEDNDDGSTAAIDLGFAFDFYGDTFSQVYINNNGNVTFEGRLGDFSPDGFPQTTPIVAAFWADVDTRDGLGAVHQSRGVSSRGNPYFQVDWVDVGKYSRNGSNRNDFSLYMENDPLGDIVAFFYRSMRWTNESVGAQIGFDSGNGTNFLSFGRPVSTNDLVFLNNVEFAFRIGANGTPEPIQLEEGLPGSVIYIDSNENGLRDEGERFEIAEADLAGTLAVNEAGRYQFTDMIPGSYVLRQELPAGYRGTAPANGVRRVTVTGSGEILGGQNFGRAEVASLSGRAFIDSNRNVREDGADAAMVGATVFVDLDNDGLRDGEEPFTLTDGSGAYRFDLLPVGTHRIRAVAADGRSLVIPSGQVISVTLRGGERRTGVNFGFESTDPPRVVSVTPAPSAEVSDGVSRIAVGFDNVIDAAARWGGLFELQAAGGDGRFDNGNELGVELTVESWNSTSRVLTLRTEDLLPRDQYRLTATDALIDTNSVKIDGDFRGVFPSGDGEAGGDFVMEFVVTNRPPVSLPFAGSTSQIVPLTVQLAASDLDGEVTGYRITRQPAHGTLVATGLLGEYVYTPDGVFVGEDRFEFVATDGIAESRMVVGEIWIARSPLDFEPEALSVVSSAPVVVGRPTTFAWEVRNLGPGASTDLGGIDWYDELYLSDDAIWDEGDVLLKSVGVDHESVSVDGNYRMEQSVTIPISERTGSAYVIVRANASRRQFETEVGNNTLALGIELGPTIDLTSHAGIFLGKQNGVVVGWRDADQQGSGIVSIGLDVDQDPSNGTGHVLLATGIGEDADGVGDSIEVTVPATIATGEYYLWARLESSAGTVFSLPVRARVYDEVYLGEDQGGTPVGGGSYEVFGVDLGREGDKLYYRVRTNYDPLERGGDVYVNVGGSFDGGGGRLAGIAVRDRTTSTGQQVKAGELYTDASFLGGSIRKQHPIFLERYGRGRSGVASAAVTSTPEETWGYEINGYVSLDALGADPDDSIQVGWGMYCGNDFSETDNDKPRLNLLGAGFEIQLPEDQQEANAPRRWGDAVTIQYHVVNQGNGDIGPTRVRFVLSSDSTITLNDLELSVESGQVDIPALPVGQNFGGEVTIRLPADPPEGFEVTGTIHLGMISDAGNSVEESDEDDNFNFGYGFDKDDLRIGRPQYVNVLIHGWDPHPFSYSGMWSKWQSFGESLVTFAESSGNATLENNVAFHSTEWSSSEGWHSAFIDVMGYAAIEVAQAFIDDPITNLIADQLQELFLLDAENAMVRAERFARMAAAKTVADVRNASPSGEAALLGSPSEDQWIHVIGHSRGGAVGSEVVRQLRILGYQIDQFTTLDGYSTDWPWPSNILADIDIVNAVRSFRADRQINYRVEQGLMAIVSGGAEDILEAALGYYLDEPIDIGFTEAIVNRYADWRAPDRDGFQSVTMPGQGALSHHASISELYFDPIRRATENPYDAMLTAAMASAGGLSRDGGPPSLPAEAPPADPAARNAFIDGEFDQAAAVLRMRSEIETIPTFDDPLVDTILRMLDRPGFGVDSSLDVAGQFRLVNIEENPALELTQTNATWYQDLVDLSLTAERLLFGYRVNSAGPGDQLVVTFEGEEIARLDLVSAVGGGFQNAEIAIGEFAGRTGQFRFALSGPVTSPAVLELDQLQIGYRNSWQNVGNPRDVNGDSRITGLDALIVINYLNSGAPRELATTGMVPPPYVDVDGNQLVTPLDSLLVINYLNQGGEGEGEIIDELVWKEDVTEESAKLDGLSDLYWVDPRVFIGLSQRGLGS